MRSLLWGCLAAAFVLPAGPAAAVDIPGNASTKAVLKIQSGFAGSTLGSFELDGDVDWYRVRLEQGKDYAVRFTAHSCETPAVVTLRDSKRRPILSFSANTLGDTGVEYRATSTGTYFVDVKGEWNPDDCDGPEPYFIVVMSDCRNDATTRCKPTLGRTWKGVSAWFADRDRFAVTLDVAKRYAFKVTGAQHYTYCRLELLDGRGSPLVDRFGMNVAEIKDFEPARSGRHYLRVSCDNTDDFGAEYELVFTAG